MIDLAVAKAHLRVDQTDEDALIASYIAAATAHLNTLNVPTTAPAAMDVQQAALLLIGHWYASREAVVTGTIATDLPLGFHALIAPHRSLIL